MARPKKYIINLTDEEMKVLKSTIHKKNTSKTIRNRCQIILDLDKHTEKFLHMSKVPNRTVSAWQPSIILWQNT